MTIDEAIDYIDTRAKDLEFQGFDRESQALKLGIEALKHLKECWEARVCERTYLLPGETEE